MKKAVIFGASGWFTALNDGKASAILSFCRMIIFLVIPVLILPRIFKTNGVWYSMSVGEGMSLVMAIYYFRKFKALWNEKKQSSKNLTAFCMA